MGGQDDGKPKCIQESHYRAAAAQCPRAVKATRECGGKTGPLVDIVRSGAEQKHSASQSTSCLEIGRTISEALCRTEALRRYMVAGSHV